MNLLEIHDDDFARIVDQDIREQTSQTVHDGLRSATVRPRWMSTLNRMKKDIEWQVSNDRAAREEYRVACLYGSDHPDSEGIPLGVEGWHVYISKQERWRANTLRVLKGIEKCIAEIPFLESLDKTTTDMVEFKSSIEWALDLLSVGEDEEDNRAIEILNSILKELS